MPTKLSRFLTLAKSIWNAIYLRGDTNKRTNYIIDQMIGLGGVYLKFLQIIVLKNPELMIGKNHRHLRMVYDQAQPEPISIESLLVKELGDKASKIRDFELQPFACGSFGQVYKATLEDGTKAIIKIIRPSVVKNIEFDLRILGWAANTLALFNKGAYDIKNIFKEFSSITRAELDYREESAYAYSLYLKYRDSSHIIIPKTYTDLCTDHIIVQEYLDGLPATQALDKRGEVDPVDYVYENTGSDLRTQLVILGEEILTAMLSDGYSHGDPHPGNILFMPGNKIGLIDFGIKARSPADKKAFYDLIKEYQKIYSGQFDFEGYTMALIGLFVSDLKTAIHALDRYNDGLVSKSFLNAISTAARSIFNSSPQEVAHLIESSKYSTIFNSVINENNRFGFKINIQEPEFIRATHMFIALVDTFGLKKEVFRDVYSSVVVKFSDADFPSYQKSIPPEIAAEYVADWLSDIADKDIYLFNMITSKLSRRVLNV